MKSSSRATRCRARGALRFQSLSVVEPAGGSRRRGDRSRHPARRAGATCRARSREAARNHDLVLTSGGVSTGEADHVRDAVEKLGKLVFWRVAIKPGRPVAMGVLPGDQRTAARPLSACREIRWRRS